MGVGSLKPGSGGGAGDCTLKPGVALPPVTLAIALTMLSTDKPNGWAIGRGFLPPCVLFRQRARDVCSYRARRMTTGTVQVSRVAIRNTTALLRGSPKLHTRPFGISRNLLRS